MATRDDTTFFGELLRAPVFPFRGDGLVLMLMACAWLVVTQFMAGCVPVVGFIVSLAGVGFFYAYLMRVVSAVASGDDELPAFQEINSWWDDGLVPSFQVLVLLVLYFAPAAGLLFAENEIGALVAAGAATFLLPMGLLNLSLRTSLLDPAPAWQLKCITSAPLSYLLCVICMGGVVAAQVSLTPSGNGSELNLVVLGLTIVVSTYANLVNAFILGRFYYHNEVELD